MDGRILENLSIPASIVSVLRKFRGFDSLHIGAYYGKCGRKLKNKHGVWRMRANTAMNWG